MRHRSNVSPDPLPVEATDAGIVLEYQDGRRVEYGATSRRPSGDIEATTAYEIHVLVTDEAPTEGVMVYVNDYNTSDDILESTGVGRLILGDGEQAAVYPGVTARRDGERITISTDAEAVEGRVYSFVENQLDERAYRLA